MPLADDRKRDGNEPQDKPLILDMGQGSREQGFKAQRPALKLVHSR